MNFDVAILLLGSLVVGLALLSKPLSRSPFPPSLIALVFGVLVGPGVLGWIDLSATGDEPLIREGIARLTLGIALIGVALRVPPDFPRRQWRSILVLVGPGMLAMWGISWLLVHLILDLPVWLSGLIAAALTPTDPIAATPIVTGEEAEENIPQRIRDTISMESGLNDGLGYLFVVLAFLMLTEPAADAVRLWSTRIIFWEVVAAGITGALIGYAGAWALRWADRKELVEGDWRLIYTVALALAALGLGRLMGSDEILIAFVAGVAFAQVADAEEREEEDRGQEAVNRFFSIPIFAVFGTTLPWQGWQELGWRGILLAVAILALRRIPVVLALRPWLATVHTRREALFMGWFGPIAVAAIYYASLMEHRLDDPRIWHVVSLVIVASAIAHGMTGAALTRKLGRGG